MIIILIFFLICISILYFTYRDNKMYYLANASALPSDSIKNFTELRNTIRTNSPVSTSMIKYLDKMLPIPPPLPPVDFILPSPYKNTKCECEIDPANVEPLKKLRAPVNACTNYLSEMNNASVWYKTEINDDVILAFINSLADNNSLGKVNSQGVVDRMFRFHIPIVLTALRCTDKLKPNTLKWIKDDVVEHQQTLQTRKNNLKAWLVLDLALTTILLQDTDMMTSVDKGWNDVISLISNDGSLPSEDEREDETHSKKAEYYEFFCKALVTTGFVLKRTNPLIPKLVAKTVELNKTDLIKLSWLYLYNKMYPKIEETVVQSIIQNVNSKFIVGHILLFS